MNNNGGKINLLGANAQQIKVNLKQKNPNINFNEVPIFPENFNYDKLNSNKYYVDEMKNVKYQQYIAPNAYTNQNIFTEYDSFPKYPMNPSNIYKIENIPSKDFQMIYSNTNENRNKEKIISKRPNRQYNYKNNTNNALSHRPLIKQRKTVSNNKGSNKLMPFKNIYNNKSNNPPKTTNKKTNLKIGTKLNITKSEIQYPLNYIRNIPINNYMSYNNTDAKEEIGEDEINIKNPVKAHSKNKKNDIGKYYISSTNNINDTSNKKIMRQNKSNFGLINRRKNINELNSPEPININHITSNNPFTNFNTFSKNDNDTINSYNSYNNFYHKDERSHLRKKNDMNLNLHSIMNNFGYLNTISNSIEENNRINPLYANINNHHEIFENDNRKTYINIVEPDFKINNRKIKKNNNVNSINSINLNAAKHTKGKRSVDIVTNINNNNNDMKFNNILDINKYIQYKKKLLEEFCHCLEEFIFINVKNNFDSFIFKLREYSKKKYFNSLLLKRLQNKGIKKNYYKERSSSSNKSMEPNPVIPYYFSNIRTNKRDEFYIPREYIGRKTSNNYPENMPDMVYDSPRLTKNYRIGKSHGRYDINSIDNYNSNYNNYYDNDSYFNNIGNIYDYENNRYRKINSIEKYSYNFNFNDNTLYVPKKLKRAINNLFSDKKNFVDNYRNVNPYYNTMNEIEQKILSPEIDDVNKSHDIDKDMIKAKIIKKNNYNMNYYKINNNLKDISYDNNYTINKNIENGLLNSTNHNIKNKNAAPIEKIKKVKTNQVYKKKIKITKIKSKIIKKKNISFNNINKEEKNIKKEEQTNSNIMKAENTNKQLEKIKEQNLELLNANNINDNNKKENKNESNPTLSDDKGEIKDTNDNNNQVNIRNESLSHEKNENGNNVNINKDEEDNLNKLNNNDINNQKQMKEIKENNRYEQYNNPINENKTRNGNNIINEDTDESDENITREIIVKDVSTIDKRLNVFIKYIQLPKINIDPNKQSYNYFNHHSLILFQTDSIYLPSLYPNKYNYYNYNHYYGNTNDKKNKLKLHKILSSIIEEEEKSKVAGSANNSIISEEENCNGNYSNFYIQSIKYVTNFLQSILDDKKKDICFDFFKTLKRIKNEAFLKGLINQKKMQFLNNLKDDNDMDEENENNTSGDVILYNVNDNFNVDIDYFGSKSNDRKDISKNRNKNIKNKNKLKNVDKKKEKIKEEENYKKSENQQDIIPDKKYSSASNFHKFKEENLVVNNNINLSMDLDKKEIKKKILDCINEDESKNKQDKIEKLKIDNDNRNDLNNNIEINDNVANENEINVDYEKNVTISEACRGLSDVILDFKIYLVRFCLKNMKNSK